MEYISYEGFGRRFFALVATEERVLSAVNLLAGQPIDVGPIGVGPAKLVKLTAKGAIGEAMATPTQGSEVGYRVVLPVSVRFDVDLQVETHSFRAELEVPIVLTARAVAPLAIYLDITPPRARDVEVQVTAEGLRASVLQRVAGVEGEVRRFVAEYVAREVSKPYVERARLIDVSSAIDKAWSSVGPHRPSPTAEHVASDFSEAIGEEILENPALQEDLTD